MVRNILFVLLGLFIAFSLLVYSVSLPRHLSNFTPNLVAVGDTQIKLRIARTSDELEKGLGGLASMPENEGMLFVMNRTSRHAFWMKGMEFPLDFVWIAGNKIVDITENVPISNNPTPAIISPQKPCNYVLEVNAGFVKRHGVKVGQKLKLVY